MTPVPRPPHSLPESPLPTQVAKRPRRVNMIKSPPLIPKSLATENPSDVLRLKQNVLNEPPLPSDGKNKKIKSVFTSPSKLGKHAQLKTRSGIIELTEEEKNANGAPKCVLFVPKVVTDPANFEVANFLPGLSFAKAIPSLAKQKTSDWIENYFAVETVRKVLASSGGREVIQSYAHIQATSNAAEYLLDDAYKFESYNTLLDYLVTHVLKSVSNLRSAVARNGLYCLNEMLCLLGADAMSPRFDQMALPLLKLAGNKAKKFLLKEVDKTMSTVSEKIPFEETAYVFTLLKHVENRQPVITFHAARYYILCVKEALRKAECKQQEPQEMYVANCAENDNKESEKDYVLDLVKKQFYHPRLWDPLKQLNMLRILLRGRNVEGKRLAKCACRLLTQLHTDVVMRPLFEQQVNCSKLRLTPREIKDFLLPYNNSDCTNDSRGINNGNMNSKVLPSKSTNDDMKIDIDDMPSGNPSLVRKVSLRNMLRARRKSGTNIDLCLSPKISILSPARPSPWKRDNTKPGSK